jgi:hypothetical protein
MFQTLYPCFLYSTECGVSIWTSETRVPFIHSFICIFFRHPHKKIVTASKRNLFPGSRFDHFWRFRSAICSWNNEVLRVTKEEIK